MHRTPSNKRIFPKKATPCTQREIHEWIFELIDSSNQHVSSLFLSSRSIRVLFLVLVLRSSIFINFACARDRSSLSVWNVIFLFLSLFLFCLLLIFIRLFISSFSFASLFKEKKTTTTTVTAVCDEVCFLREWLTRREDGTQLKAFRKPGERPNGRTDGFDRALLLNDVDIVVVGKWSSESELPGVVLIIIDVNTSSLSSTSCRWTEETMNWRTSIEETTHYFSVVALFDSTGFIRFISIIIIDRLNKHGRTFQNVRIKRKEWVEKMRW